MRERERESYKKQQRYKLKKPEIMRRKNSKETISSHNSTTTEPANTEVQRLPEGQFRTLIVEMIQDFQKEFRESLKVMKNQINKESDIQTGIKKKL